MTQPQPSTGIGLIAAAIFSYTVQAEGLLIANNFEPTLSDGRIEILRTDGSDRRVLREPGGSLRGVAIYREHLIWSDVEAEHLARVELAHAGGPATEIVSQAGFVQDLELSYSTGRFFWIETVSNQVMSADVDGNNVETVFFANATTIAIDDLNQKIYAENRLTASRGSIVRASFDGSSVETLVKDVPTATSMAVDPVEGYVFWTSSAGLTDGDAGVYRVNTDGSDFRELFVMGDDMNTSGICIDAKSNHVYWGQGTAVNQSDIYRMNFDGSYPQLVASGYGNINDMMHLAAYPELPLAVGIDIRPGPTRNFTNPNSHARLWVTVLSNVETGFDPLQIDMKTVSFGPAQASPTFHRVQDLNRDGVGDLWLRFRVRDTGIQPGDTSASLVAETYHGQALTGTDEIGKH